ncbi:MAG TPA: tetratricopeptide repeat protein [Drouetiella sp.]|jgi:tetratricopeptide (TPR) repeat protein
MSMTSWIQAKDDALKAEAEGDYASAVTCWLRTIALLRGAEVKDVKVLCAALERLAAVYVKDHTADLAIEPLRESLAIKIKELGHLHLAVGHVQNELAKAHFLSKNLEEAAVLANECLKCYESGFGEDSQEVATIALNLAATYHLGGLFAEAEPHYKRSLAIRTKGLGADNPHTIKVLQNYAKLLREMHRPQEADFLDQCAFGSITGSWKTLEIPQTEAVTTEDICQFCGNKLNGETKCSRCGTLVA